MPIRENPADIEQREKLAREGALAVKSRVCDIIITAAFCLFVGGFALFHLILPDRNYSERENRVLEQMPEFSSESLFSGEFTADMTKYLSDQFPLRDFFVSVKAGSERALLRSENGGVMFSGDSLTARNDFPDTETLDTNISSASAFADALGDNGIPTVLAAAGRRADVCDSTLPALYGDESQNDLWETIDSMGEEFSGSYLNLRDSLRERAAAGEEVYYRTDHHWTALGAYYAYRELWDALPDTLTEGKSPREIAEFTCETVSDSFYGTSYSASGASWISPDTIELFRIAGDDKIPVTVADTGETLAGLYRYEFLEVRDKYSVFLGENAGRLDIGDGSRPVIMMIKDSFAQSIAPFLFADFDIVMIDPRYYVSESIYRTALELQPEAVVILMNADTLTSDDVLYKLRRGVE